MYVSAKVMQPGSFTSAALPSRRNLLETILLLGKETGTADVLKVK